MARRFPEDRTAFLYGAPGTPLLAPDREPLTIYSDKECTARAPITNLLGDPIPDSVIFLGDDALVPEFLCTDDTMLVLWAKPTAGDAYALDAHQGDRLNDLEQRVYDLETGGLARVRLQDLYLGSPPTEGQDYTWFTVPNLAARLLVWRFTVSATGTSNRWSVRVTSQPAGAGEVMLEATLSASEYACSWPWVFENQQVPAADDFHVGLRNFSAVPMGFTLTDLRGEVLHQ